MLNNKANYKIDNNKKIIYEAIAFTQSIKLIISLKK